MSLPYTYSVITWHEFAILRKRHLVITFEGHKTALLGMYLSGDLFVAGIPSRLLSSEGHYPSRPPPTALYDSVLKECVGIFGKRLLLLLLQCVYNII